MKKETTIKEVKPADFKEAAKVIRAAFAPVAEEFGITGKNDSRHASFMTVERLEEMRGEGCVMFGLFEEAKIHGFIAVRHMENDIYYLERLAVSPETGGKGHGRALVEHGIRFVKESGGKRISIGMINESRELKEWYKRMGFREAEIKTIADLPFRVCMMEMNLWHCRKTNNNREPEM